MSTESVPVSKGLVGVVADTTAISKVNEETNSLLYRGYPVQELASSCSFEEVAYLLWNGELPSGTERTAFSSAERSRRAVDPAVLAALGAMPASCHPMDVLRTGVSLLGANDAREGDNSVAANQDKALDLLAQIPTIVAAEQRRRHGKAPIAPDSALPFAENFFQMCFGEVPEKDVVRCFEISMVLYAEHSFNASTFTARVIASTLSEMHSAITGAIGALKGPLHGGANEAVMAMMLEIGAPENAEAWLAQALASKRKIMGFGHRVYKHGDSRVPTMRAALETMAATRDGAALLEIYERLERVMLESKAIHPNLDFPAGPAYHLMGFDVAMFTPLFVVSRITGWTAHVMEQLSANALIRPLAAYDGPAERHVPPR